MIYNEVKSAVGKHYAVIVDEAHSSQTGQSALKLKAALADVSDALAEYAELEEKAIEEVEANDILVQEMLSQGKHSNMRTYPSLPLLQRPKAKPWKFSANLNRMVLSIPSTSIRCDRLSKKDLSWMF